VGAGLFSVAGVLAFYGGAALIACAVLALALVVAPWLAALIVGVAVLLVAGVLALVGKGQVQAAAPPVPQDRCGFFRRSVTLPLHVQADAIEASTEDGVLQVVIPKVEEAKPKRIEVRAVPTMAHAAHGTFELGETSGVAGEELADRDTQDWAGPVAPR
jgi:uncharacterized protein (DUF58 family)